MQADLSYKPPFLLSCSRIAVLVPVIHAVQRVWSQKTVQENKFEIVRFLNVWTALSISWRVEFFESKSNTTSIQSILRQIWPRIIRYLGSDEEQPFCRSLDEMAPLETGNKIGYNLKSSIFFHDEHLGYSQPLWQWLAHFDICRRQLSRR